MTVQLNHTIVHAHHSRDSAIFMAEILGLPAPSRFGPFWTLETSNGVSLAFLDDGGEIAPQHYAFLISEPEFDAIFARIRERELRYWADPGKTRPGEINQGDGGRGVYFEDPNAHFLEIITRPYGG